MNKDKIIRNSSSVEQAQKKLGFFQRGKLRILSMAMALAALMSVSAFAADGETSSATISSLVSEASTSVPAVMTLVWNLMVANPLMTFFIVSSIVFVGFKFIRRGIKAVR